MGVFEFFKQLVNGWEPKEPQKQLPAPDIIMCGLCEVHIETSCLFAHWLRHTLDMYVDPTEIAHSYGILRTEPAVHNKVFSVTRPDYNGAYKHPRFNLELLTAAYFNYAITVLKLQNPHMRFQYINAVMGDTGQYLKTLLIVGEWYE
jgi:hypothetical protein